MDKTGNPTYLRLPRSLEAKIDELARAEGRTKNQMIIHLLSLGVHTKSFRIDDYCSTNFFCDERQSCKEK
jgi:hypothetical protein